MNRHNGLNKCTTHCGRCGAHFNSTSAFYAHRRGKYNPKPGERGRHCVAPEDAADPQDRDQFREVTTNGICDIRGGLKRGVTIWALARPDEYESEPDEAPKARLRTRGGGSTSNEVVVVQYKRRRRRRLEDVR